MQPITSLLNSYLDDDDEADSLFFKEALEVLPLKANLSIVQDGQQLLELLVPKGNMLPHVLFVDLNMRRKNGFAALGQIKQDKKLINLPVIVCSTTYDQIKVKAVFKDTTHQYIR